MEREMYKYINAYGKEIISPFKIDPIELTESFIKIKPEVERLIRKKIGNRKYNFGYCYVYWSAKKDVLKDHFGIEWRNPAEMNPDYHFD